LANGARLRDEIPKVRCCGGALTFVISLPFIFRPPYMEAHDPQKEGKKEYRACLFANQSLSISRSIYARKFFLIKVMDVIL